MTLYQVSYRINSPCENNHDDFLTAFVQAESFNEAARKVEQRFKKEFESATIYGISIPSEVTIII